MVLAEMLDGLLLRVQFTHVFERCGATKYRVAMKFVFHSKHVGKIDLLGAIGKVTNKHFVGPRAAQHVGRHILFGIERYACPPDGDPFGHGVDEHHLAGGVRFYNIMSMSHQIIHREKEHNDTRNAPGDNGAGIRRRHHLPDRPLVPENLVVSVAALAQQCLHVLPKI